jgi:hypothetical protein
VIRSFPSTRALALVAVTFCSAGSAPAYPSALLAQGPLAPSEVRHEGFAVPPTGGRLERIDGTLVLHLDGTLAERGFAEGYLCAEELLECFHEFALGHAVGGRAPAWDLLLLPLVRSRFEFPEDTRAWARAVATGVHAARAERGATALLVPLKRELTADDVLACAALPDIAGFMCSSFAVWGDATADGDVLVGRNLDYPSTPALERHSMVHVHAPLDGRAAWIGVGWPGTPGCLTGLSERGVFVAIHDVDGPRPRGDARSTPRA